MSPRSFVLPALLIAATLGIANGSLALAGDEADGIAFFETRIRPQLVAHCDRCHAAGPKPPKGGLLVDSRPGLLAGGDSGPALVPGKPEASLLMAALRHEGPEMPPAGRLPDRVVADFETWIRMGAPDPRIGKADAAVKPAVDVEAGRGFWAFRPIGRPQPPTPRDAAWPRGDVDRFIIGALEQSGIGPVADADPATWLRRVTFDLTGLPPSPEELAAFLGDPSPHARETVVERLLASPHYGERFGRHWLDIARFAESSGGGRSMVFNEAWRYRDYVVAAFNADKPLDRFIVEQIAGDLLPHGSPAEEEAHLVATSYLVLGPTNYEEQDKRMLEMDVIDEQIETVGKGLLAMTIGCARCHDHKFDPIPTADYYALAGIFRSTHLLVHDNVSRWTERPLPMPPPLAAAVERHEAALAAANGELAAARRALKTLDPGRDGKPAVVAAVDLPGIVLDDVRARRVGAWTESQHVKPYVGAGYLTDGNDGKGAKTLTFLPEFPGPGTYEVRLGYTAGDNRAAAVPVSLLTLDGEIDRVVDMRKPPPIEGRFVSLGTFRFDASNQWFVLVSNEGTQGYVIVDCVQFLPVDAAAQAAPSPPSDAEPLTKARDAVKELEKRVQELTAQAPPRPRAMAVDDAETIADCPICIRGNVHNPGPVVPRGVLAVATPGEPPRMPTDASGRRELAAWIADAEQPLTSRVWVNRVWHHLFGAGLVRTVDNFGTTGERPTHPELLDHLARAFTDGGWSTKSLLRALVLSRTYALSTRDDTRAAAVDPENRLLWRMNRRRLDAESIRDAMLVASGELDRTVGGPGIVDPKVQNKGSDAPTEYGYTFDDTRRSLYTPAFRNRRLELFEVFDGADPNAPTGARNTSTVAPQSLFLLNGPFVMDRARAAAARLPENPAVPDAATVDRVFLVTLGRSPRPAERERVLAELTAADGAVPRREAWERIFQALFGCIDFRYLE